ncbi:GNAT family N-acetyltransferase [Schumannella soli]|uniref:N-acetyltransferase n=1 Tax=Schumannella soli TaxID=2590779 RepID=A0A506XX48_9MICO|nr:GNAT family N-acetyltransferase [Schumannella soli]TPW74203.1 N-acetyltransferase [Schumannella soli]
MRIRPMVEGDWPAVEEIYRAGIATGNATFESEPPTWERFDATRRPELRLVATDERGDVVGWAAVSSVSARLVYAGVVEHSVYVHPDHAGRGVGRALVDQLLAQAPEAGVWTIQSSIFPENTASLRLHAEARFRTVGTRERIALMTYGPHEGQWRDTILIEWRARADH